MNSTHNGRMLLSIWQEFSFTGTKPDNIMGCCKTLKMISVRDEAVAGERCDETLSFPS